MINYGITCCKGCVEKRKRLCATGTNCHMICEDYLELKKKRKQVLETVVKEHTINQAIMKNRTRVKKKH